MLVNDVEKNETLINTGEGQSSIVSERAVPRNDEPSKKPEVEPEKLPDENPGIITEPKPHKKEDDDNDDDDDDDDDNFEPFSEPEIGDDPDRIKTKTTVM